MIDITINTIERISKSLIKSSPPFPDFLFRRFLCNQRVQSLCWGLTAYRFLVTPSTSLSTPSIELNVIFQQIVYILSYYLSLFFMLCKKSSIRNAYVCELRTCTFLLFFFQGFHYRINIILRCEFTCNIANFLNSWYIFFQIISNLFNGFIFY